jgi:hypothetical protein
MFPAWIERGDPMKPQIVRLFVIAGVFPAVFATAWADDLTWIRTA